MRDPYTEETMRDIKEEDLEYMRDYITLLKSSYFRARIFYEHHKESIDLIWKYHFVSAMDDSKPFESFFKK